MQSHFQDDDDDTGLNRLSHPQVGNPGWITINADMDNSYHVGSDIFSTNYVAQEELDQMRADFNEFSTELRAQMKELQEQIQVIERDTFMEAEYEELREAWEAYNAVLDKLKTFKALKDSK
jgi:predicted amino acid-binding ACT domain protein